MRENPETDPTDPIEVLGPVPLPDSDNRQPFLAHLEELRWRVLRSFFWIALGMAGMVRFSARILEGFLQPVGHLVFVSPAEPFMAHLTVIFFGGLLAASPFLVLEAWGFFSPALAPGQRRGILFLVPMSVGLLALGVWFGWKVLLPAALAFLMSFSSASLTPMITIGNYVGFAGWLVVGCGLIFQMPIAVLFLARVGILHPMALLKQWRLAIVAILVIAAAVTPTPDIVNQLLLAAPMAVLYFLSVALAFLVQKKDDPLRAN